MRARGPLLTMTAVGVLAAMIFIGSMLQSPASAEAENATGNPLPAAAALAPAASTPPAPASTSSDPEPLEDAVYVGHSSGNEVTVAVAVSGTQAAAYLCDGEAVESWLDGTVTGDEIVLQGRGGAQLTATVSDKAALGMVTINDRQMPFSAADAPPPAGIYEGRATVDGKLNRIGWIVLPSGRQVGINNAGGERRPAPALDINATGDVRIGGADVEVKRLAGNDPVVPR